MDSVEERRKVAVLKHFVAAAVERLCKQCGVDEDDADLNSMANLSKALLGAKKD